MGWFDVTLSEINDEMSMFGLSRTTIGVGRSPDGDQRGWEAPFRSRVRPRRAPVAASTRSKPALPVRAWQQIAGSRC